MSGDVGRDNAWLVEAFQRVWRSLAGKVPVESEIVVRIVADVGQPGVDAEVDPARPGNTVLGQLSCGLLRKCLEARLARERERRVRTNPAQCKTCQSCGGVKSLDS